MSDSDCLCAVQIGARLNATRLPTDIRAALGSSVQGLIIPLGDEPDLPNALLQLSPSQQAQIAALSYGQVLTVVERCDEDGNATAEPASEPLLYAGGRRHVPLPLVDMARSDGLHEGNLYMQAYVASVVNRHVCALVSRGAVVDE